VDEAEEALAALHVPVLVRAGFLCQPIADKRPSAKCRETEVSETEVTLLTAMNSHSMSYVLNRHKITFAKWNERAKGWRYIDPPNEVIQKLLAKGTWPRLPHVVGVVTVPTLRPDRTVLSEPGYDPATKLWYAPAGDLRLPPIRATREAAEAALTLFKDLLSEFPFVTDLDRSVALAADDSGVAWCLRCRPIDTHRCHDAGQWQELHGRPRQRNCARPEVSCNNSSPWRGGREAARRADTGERTDYIGRQLHLRPWRGDALPDGRAPNHSDVPNAASQQTTGNRTISVKHNSLGLRERGLSEIAPDRVLFLGDY
jgi:hypothetical protein